MLIETVASVGPMSGPTLTPAFCFSQMPHQMPLKRTEKVGHENGFCLAVQYSIVACKYLIRPEMGKSRSPKDLG